MHFTSFLSACPRQRSGNAHVLHWIIAVVVVCCLALTAIGENPPRDSAESQKEEVGVRKSPNNKYNVDRIGQRGVGRGVNLYSMDRERELGNRVASWFDRNNKFINDSQITDYINVVAQKIVRNSDAEVPFKVKVIDSDDIRAFGVPGGFLYVDSGLILATDGEAELATVVAHEIAHVAARHITRTATRRQLWSVANYAALFTGPASLGLEEIGGVAGPLSTKKFSRDTEYEADLLGMEYAYSAGYDPQALLAALEKLHAREIKMRPNFDQVPGYRWLSKFPFHRQIARSFSSYPLTEERIRHIQVEITNFLPDRKEYILDTSEFQEVRSRLAALQAPVLRHHHDDEPSKGPVLRRSR